ncbi:MAG: phosphotransferase [Acidimicrobiia bacterium]|nr:phosphotransferase [Acidimicrobiia bacterium]
MSAIEQLTHLLPDYLARQRWYQGDAPAEVEIVAGEVLREGVPGLVWVLARVPGDAAAYQVLVGLRPLSETENFLEGKGRGFLGDIESDDGPMLAYDALVDPLLAAAFLGVVAPDEHVETIRPMTVEQSNTSVVYDDRLILKLFRRVEDTSNPDAEVVDALAAAGYDGVPTPVATWRRDGRDLAVVRAFLSGGADGWELARTSLRDLYDRRRPPEECGGDFAPEASRLGQCLAALHISMAKAFGAQPGQPGAWADTLRDSLVDVDIEGIDAVYDELAALDPDAAGASIRVHGDLHLAQVLRTDKGWYVLDFEGEPLLPVAERVKPSSPLRDVAGMLRSFHYASEVALIERQEASEEELAGLAQAWAARNRQAFISGYRGTDDIEALLPPGESWDAVLRAFELGKAVYEVAYERAHRPDWEHIPQRAIARLLAPAP